MALIPSVVRPLDPQINELMESLGITGDFVNAKASPGMQAAWDKRLLDIDISPACGHIRG
jgi:hypothetical protein